MRIIGGSARGRRLTPPRDLSTRPALDRIRESVFGILGDFVVGAAVLDLYAGVGSFGLEALSRGASRVTFVEQNRTSFALLRQNVEELGFTPAAQLVRGDALKLPDLGSLEPHSLRLVFLDPPFASVQRPEPRRLFQGRVREILSSPALEPSALVVVRLPKGVEAEVALPSFDLRRYGESSVVFCRASCGETA